MCTSAASRLAIHVHGIVQGVGFRPFVYRLATEMGLAGWVLNSAQGVFIEVEGESAALDTFVRRVEKEKPPRAFIQGLEATHLDVIGYAGFVVRESDGGGSKSTLILPDVAACPDCIREIFDPSDRRCGYPFTNCTNCGPRFSIILRLPYDRANTTMSAFEMCPACRAEYDDPANRRFHAQPNACPQCGPRLELWDRLGHASAVERTALAAAARAILDGEIVAVKGLGGFHLVVDARNDDAVRKLRRQKGREEKPFALMVPSIQAARAFARVSEAEERLILSPETPIVLVERLPEDNGCGSAIARAVSPNNPYVGVMAPYTPLHHLLLAELGVPVVATSGNLSEEPICTEEREAIERLGNIADLFLVHNRPIARHVDDSVVRVMMNRELVLRRSRGYAPFPVMVDEPLAPMLAVGAHLKNTVAVPVGGGVCVSQHIGDLESPQSYEAFQRVIHDFTSMYDLKLEAVACDLHPDYLSTQYARGIGIPVIGIQHHFAHVLSCMAENRIRAPVLGVSWDGTGYGPDGTVWGGEFLLVKDEDYQRAAHLRTFRMPGGDKAVREPGRCALGVLYELLGDEAFNQTDLAPFYTFPAGDIAVMRAMLERGLNAPVTSSAGRLFDAFASLLGIRQKMAFEGQAAMELEFAVDGDDTDEYYPFYIHPGPAGADIVDWGPTVLSAIGDSRRGAALERIASKIHNSLVDMILSVSIKVGVERVALTGGCFQNRCLTERAVRRLREEGFRPYWHQRIPPNDGGISLGQLVGAARILRSGAERKV